MKRGLVAAQVDADITLGQPLPQVDYVALVCERERPVLGHGGQSGIDHLVEAGVYLVDPALVVALAGGGGIDLGRDANHAGYTGSLGLCAGHAAETRCDEEQTAQVAVGTQGAAGIEHSDGGAVHDTLRADIHVGAGRHLTVLRDTERIVALPVVGLGIVGNHHAVGDDHAGRARMRGEETERMARVHDQRLLVGHLAQILHHQAILGPVLKDSAVAAIGYELVGMLGDGGVEIVLNHQHDGRGLTRAGRVEIYRPRVHGVGWAVAIHIYTAVVGELAGKLGCERRMEMGREIPQGIAQGEFLLLGREDVLAARGVVDRGVVARMVGQGVGDTGYEVGADLFGCHILIWLFTVSIISASALSASAQSSAASSVSVRANSLSSREAALMRTLSAAP